MNEKPKRSAREALSEIARELGVRRRCYGRWVQDGKLSDVDATDRMERLERALELVEKYVSLEDLPPPPNPIRITAAAIESAVRRRAETAVQEGVSPELVT